MLMRLLTLCSAQIELGKADVAVGGERTHARILSEGKGVPLVANRDVEMGYRRVLRNFTEDVQGSSFVPSLSPPTRDAQRVRPELRGFIASPRRKVGAGELRCEQGVPPARCDETLQAFFQERNGFAKTSGDRVRMAQSRHQGARPPGDTQAFRHLDALFKERDRHSRLSLLKVEVAEPPTGDDLTERLLGGLGDGQCR